ncbi:hypothetical protein BDV59DRAFT_196556 [Aspergillus ambiguus]|uniref:uncharacterized protein n=1 Tax=Aspergillus ambiguus TaxID=176160 RepID=UPI003CCE313D
MVSLWPFKGQDDSPASFEKTLSTLSTKISQTTARLDSHRQHARRFKALWTLYTTFAYLLYTIIVALVLGWENWGITEFAALIGGPIVIFGVRTGATKFFDFRINKTQRHLDDLHKQRDETIEKLKIATKYNSTQQLLEKYAGEPSPKPSRAKGGDQEKRRSDAKRKPSTPQQAPVQRTGLPPPPTANIRRPAPIPETPPQVFPPSPNPNYQQPPRGPPPPNMPPSPMPAFDEPGFAPNAFPSAPQYVEQHRWYDRLLDVLLGEDETQLKNRMVLICTTCRLVNGQAPPGIKTPEELGRWRCGSCGAWNGEESETTKVLERIQNESRSGDGAWESVSRGDGDNQSSVDDVTDDAVMVATAMSDDEPADTDSGASEDVEKEEKAEPQPKQKSKRGRTRGGK